MYLWRKDAGFFFQMRIPARQAVNLGATPLRVWLGALKKREAQRRATALAAAAVEGISRGMDRQTLTRSLKALADELETLRRAEFSAGLGALGARTFASEEAAQGPSADPELVGHFRQAEARATGRKQAMASVRSRLAAVGQALDTDAAALAAERAAYAHALATVAAIERPAVSAAPVAVPAPVHPVTEGERRDKREITADTLLSAAGKVILDLRKEAKGESVKGDDRYQERLEHALAAFIDVIGDEPLRYYLPLHMQEFANAMAKCPKNRRKYPQFKGLSILEMAKANAELKKPIPTLSTSAVGSIVSEVGNLWAKATASVANVKDLKSYKITMPGNARRATTREGLLPTHGGVCGDHTAPRVPPAFRPSVQRTRNSISAVPVPDREGSVPRSVARFPDSRCRADGRRRSAARRRARERHGRCARGSGRSKPDSSDWRNHRRRTPSRSPTRAR